MTLRLLLLSILSMFIAYEANFFFRKTFAEFHQARIYWGDSIRNSRLIIPGLLVCDACDQYYIDGVNAIYFGRVASVNPPSGGQGHGKLISRKQSRPRVLRTQSPGSDLSAKRLLFFTNRIGLSWWFNEHLWEHTDVLSNRFTNVRHPKGRSHNNLHDRIWASWGKHGQSFAMEQWQLFGVKDQGVCFIQSCCYDFYPRSSISFHNISLS